MLAKAVRNTTVDTTTARVRCETRDAGQLEGE